jgi:hypothetical protein
MRQICLLALSTIGLVGTAASAQSTDRTSSASAAVLPAGLRASMDRLADSARALGIPSEPLYLKAAEGQLKGADEARVLDVVRRLVGELVMARRMLGPGSATGELVAGANAIHARVEPERLRELREASVARHPGSSLVMPLVVVADLVSRRVTPDVAVASVRSLVTQGAPDQEFASLRTAVERDIAGGQVPDLAMRARTDVTLRALGGGALPVERRQAPRPPETP